MSLADEVGDFRRMLDEVSVVGHPSRKAQLTALERLIHLFPEEARAILARLDRGT
ncbi:hypothetical protein NE236_34495 [Actinoallomurus purpureus]|uniref:hypothetical protein n=1 Tax=Actinoallomurus purpureus TaxID=478114 RepID=UPI002093E771|nr:hypothetical protein [Actinoallomurus purpureus]MCO6010089.1 hypothetical protein [Actinoallomurus purpureus]